MANNKAAIEKEIAEYKELIADASVPNDEKEFAKGEIADLEKQLATLEKKAPAKAKKAAPVKKEKKAKAAPAKKAKKEKKKKKQSPVTTYKYKNKSIKDLDESECAEMKKEVAERRAKAKASGKKSKSKPVIEKITGNVATAVKQAINNESADDIKKDPKKFIARAEKIEKAAVSFLTEMKSILGDDFDKDAIEDEFADIHKLILDLKKKYGK